MWRLLYAKRKLKKNEKEELEQALDGMSFSCGAQLQDVDIPVHLKEIVYVRHMSIDPSYTTLLSTRTFVSTMLPLCLHGVTVNHTIHSAPTNKRFQMPRNLLPVLNHMCLLLCVYCYLLSVYCLVCIAAVICICVHCYGFHSMELDHLVSH